MSTPPTTTSKARLNRQTGMPPIVQSRSREIIYDALELNPRFIKNKFGPLALYLTRPNMRW